MRVGLFLVLAASLVAVEESTPAPPAPAPPPAITFKAGGMSMSLAADRPSEASSGVWIRYEAVRLECDRLTYSMSAQPGGKQPVLSTADLFGGPNGPSDGRVLFDSTNSQLPQVAFRGVMRPRVMAVRRLPGDPARPTEVRFRAEATDLGDVNGVIATPAGPRRHVVWAERAVLEIVGQADPGGAMGVASPRLAALHFYGHAQAPARPATVLRMGLQAPAEPSTVDALLATKGYGMRVAGAVISLYFDELGGLQTIEGVEESELLDGENLIPLKAPNRPVLGK
jgi:hypothetical protein